MSLKTILITYVIGGLTLPPLFIAALIYLFVLVVPKQIAEESQADDDLSEFSVDEAAKLKLTELEDKETDGVNTYKSGWLTVTREYHTFVNNANDNQLEQKNTENKSAYTALYKLVRNSTQKDIPASPGAAEGDISSPNNISKNVKRKNRYFGVLRHGNLFLYKDESQKDVQHVIVLSNNVVSIWPRTLQDGELFTKRSSIVVLKKVTKSKSEAPPKSSSASLGGNEMPETTLEVLESGIIPSKHSGFFIYTDSNYEKEDWYFSLIKATKRCETPTGSDLDKIDPEVYANPLHFKTADIISLIQTLHSSEGQLQTRWFNALIGRIFLSLQNTEFFENVIKAKILKKLAKINKPGFLDDFQIKKIFAGNSAPFISFPRLIELNPDGSLKVGFQFSYKGELSLQVATKANINLGSHFKTREVSVLLAVTLNKLEGPMIVSLKSPPSSRLWYTFEKMPDLDMKIEPIVSQRQLTYGMITKVIENKFRDAIKDSLVAPAWDDVSFFNTTEEFYRGGIWDTTQRLSDRDTHHLDEGEKEGLENQYDLEDESVCDLESANVNTDGGATSDFNNIEDTASIRSRGTVRSKTSITTPISSFSKRKTDPLIATSEEQFLSNGSFVTKGSSGPSSPTKAATFDSVSDQGSKSSKAMQIISEETVAGKKTITNSLKKIGKWYNEKNKSSSSLNKQEKDSYKPPEMIQSRKTVPALRNTSSNLSISPSIEKKSTSRRTSDGRSIESLDGKSSLNRPAPQAHNFPTEYLYGLDQPEEKTRDLPPSKIPDMKSPYENFKRVQSTSETDGDDFSLTSPKKLNRARRKPVEGDEALKQMESVEDNSEAPDPISEPRNAALISETSETLIISEISEFPQTSVTQTKADFPAANPTAAPQIPARKPQGHRKPPASEQTTTFSASSPPPPLPPREISEISVVNSAGSENVNNSTSSELQNVMDPPDFVSIKTDETQESDGKSERDTAAAIAASLAYVKKED